MTAITVSELGSVDPYYSLLNSIRSRQRAIKREWEYCCQKEKRGIARANFPHNAREALAVLHQMEVQLDIPSIKSNEISPVGKLLDLQGDQPRSVREHAEVGNNEEKVDATQLEVRKRFSEMGSSRDQKEAIFGAISRNRSNPPIWLRLMMDKLKDKGAAARMSENKWRMVEEVTLRVEQGWFIVFNTLTVDNPHYKEVFSKGSTAWKYYIQALDRAVGLEIYDNVRASWSAKKTDPFHTYFGIVERNGPDGRLHIHVIHCFRAIPANWRKDPNARLDAPIRRQIGAMWKLWPYGHSVPIAVRFNERDEFGKLGWCWPVRKVGTKFLPIEAKPPIAIARYMCKYLMKAYGSDKGQFEWRTRVSNKFGLVRMCKVVETLPRDVLWRFLNAAPMRIKIKDTVLPTSRLRLECLRSLLRVTRSGSPVNELNSLQLQTVRKLLMEVNPQLPIAARLRSLTRKTTKSSLLSTIIFGQRTSNDTAGSDVKAAFEEEYGKGSGRYGFTAGVPRDRVRRATASG